MGRWGDGGLGVPTLWGWGAMGRWRVCRRNSGEGVAVLDATCYNCWNPQGRSGSFMPGEESTAVAGLSVT
ncbi:hypothetical protein CEN44_22230 [Fischerella muscicola CCMEE 5323]|uniref:Uncharacterized protein n=1 Tax=Fischerella muscicola CCMEE 5323 TaxID=2019572 RepID=A0A2N6JXW6_FISMU|nr:hypothetical protein CEN44_22230 [Fischerella muscicola CCMEE 5323]